MKRILLLLGGPHWPPKRNLRNELSDLVSGRCETRHKYRPARIKREPIGGAHGAAREAIQGLADAMRQEGTADRKAARETSKEQAREAEKARAHEIKMLLISMGKDPQQVLGKGV